MYSGTQLKLFITGQWRYIFYTLFLIIYCLAGLFFYRERAVFLENPLSQQLEFQYPDNVQPTIKGGLLVVDRDKTRLVKVDSKGFVNMILDGGAYATKGFSLCEELLEGANGEFYVLDRVIDERGLFLAKERIIRYTSDGLVDREMIVFDYTDAAGKIVQNGRIVSLRLVGNDVYFLYASENSLTLYRINQQGSKLMVSFPLENAYFNVADGVIADNLQNIVYLNKRGEIISCGISGRQMLYKGFVDSQLKTATSIPHDLAMDADGKIYFSDRGSNSCIRWIDENGQVGTLNGLPAIGHLITKGVIPIYKHIGLSHDNQRLAASDSHSNIILRELGNAESISLLREVRISPLLVLQRSLIFGMALSWLLFGIYLIIKLIMRVWRFIQSSRSMAFCLVGFCTCFITSLVFLTYYNSFFEQELQHTIATSAHAADKMVDGDALKSIRTFDDCDSDAMLEVRGQLAELTQLYYNDDVAMYYHLYQTNGWDVYQIASRTDNGSSLRRLETVYPQSVYQDVWDTGQIKFFDLSQSYGHVAVTYAIAPLHTKDGQIAGLIEIGVDKRVRLIQQKLLFFKVIAAVVTALVIAALCFTEIRCGVIAFKQRYDEVVDVADRVRPITFCTILAMYFSSAFLPIYATDIYEPWSGISTGIAIAAPISISALMMSICSYLGGSWLEKMGIKHTLIVGGIITAAGFGICAYFAVFHFLLLGRAVSGGGIGIVLAALNAAIAEQKDSELVERGFTAYYAAYFAALNVGVVAGGWTAAWFGYSEAFAMAAVAALGGVGCTCFLIKGNNEADAVNNSVPEESGVTTAVFIGNRFTWSFLLLLYAPYLIAGYFMYYFFPIFADSRGFDEVQIAQIFLLNGLSVVYLGPYITNMAIKFFGNVGAAMFGSVVCISVLGLFVWSPDIYNAVLVIIVLGLADSFVYTAQASYYMTLPLTVKYGTGRASGIKNVVENTADTAAPFIYGGALMAGIKSGITMIASGVLVLLTLFWLIIRRR